MIGTTERICSNDKLLGGNSIELEHFVMTRDDHSHPDSLSKMRRFLWRKVASHSTSWITPIDGQHGEIDPPSLQPFNQTIVGATIATVVNCFSTDFDDVANEPVIAVLVGFEGFVSGWDGIKNERPEDDRVAIR